METGEINAGNPPKPDMVASNYHIETTVNNLVSTLSPDDRKYSTEILGSITANKRHVEETEFDVVMHMLSEKSDGISKEDQYSLRKHLCRQYIGHLDKINPYWRKYKEKLYAYPGITEEWQLFDPYNAVMTYIHQEPDQGIPRDRFPVALVLPKTADKGASVLSQSGKEHLGFEELLMSLADAGYTTNILNAEQKGLTPDEVVANMVRSGSRVVGINVTSMTIREGLKIARAIKKINPNVFVVFGGHHISLSVQEEDVLKNPKFKAVDAIIVGKGDLTLPLLTDALRKGKPLEEIPDVVVRNKTNSKGIINAWRAIPLSKYRQIRHVQLAEAHKQGISIKKARLNTGEGCIGNCSFCTSVKLYDRQYNPRDVRQVVDEMEFLSKNYGIETVYFTDDIFIKPGKDGLKRGNAFCDELERRRLRMQFRPFLRADSIPLTEDGNKLFKRLGQNGMIMTYVGLEFASQDMLNKTDKYVHAEDYIKLIQRAKKEGVMLQLGFIAWHPLMNLEDAKQGFQFLNEVDELYNFAIMVQKLDVFPGTRDKVRLQELGLLPADFDCTSDSQNYEFADPKLGALADALNVVYKKEKRLENFDADIAQLHLTIVPEIIHKATDIESKNPTSNLNKEINRLKTRYQAIMKEINQTLYAFAQNHLLQYGIDEDLTKATSDKVNEMLPKLNKLIESLREEVNLLESACLKTSNT